MTNHSDSRSPTADSRPSWRTYDSLAKAGEFGNPLAVEAAEFTPDATRCVEFVREAVQGAAVVLDVGCGPGWPGLELAHEAGLVVGLDASPAMLKMATENRDRLRRNRAVFVRALAESIPLREGSVNAAVSLGALGAVDQPGAVMAELARVVAPGGLLASLEQDFGAYLEAHGAVPEYYAGVREGEPWLARVTLETGPDRLETRQRRLSPAGSLCHLLRARGDQVTGTEAEDLWRQVQLGELAAEWTEIERQWRPETLDAALAAAGFDLTHRRFGPLYGRQAMFSVHQRRPRG